MPCAKHSEKITLISCNFDISFNIVGKKQMRLVPEIIMKGNNVDIVQDNFTSVLKLLYFNILPLLKYGCKLFVVLFVSQWFLAAAVHLLSNFIQRLTVKASLMQVKCSRPENSTCCISMYLCLLFSLALIYNKYF